MSELAKVVNNEEFKTILPTENEMSKKDLFNSLYDTQPINQLQKIEKFKILGLIPEIVRVPKDNKDIDFETGEVILPEENIIDESSDIVDDDLVDRLRLVILTSEGVYHSYSNTLNKSIAKLIAVFGVQGMKKEEYNLASRTITTKQGIRNVYVLKMI